MSSADQGAGRWIDRPGVRSALGRGLIGPYLKLLLKTSRVVVDPPDFFERITNNWPAIITSWHGQSNLAYLVMPSRKCALMISRHPDGQMMGAMARALGYETIDGSGASTRQQDGTGGLSAFRGMLRAINKDLSIFATADVPPEPGRHVSRGMIAIARRTGRPMFAIATSSSRRKVLERVWDKMQLNFPFSRVSLALEGPFYMTDPAISDDSYADELARSLDRVLAKAFDLADGVVSGATPR